jgi:hypothetical protein
MKSRASHAPGFNSALTSSMNSHCLCISFPNRRERLEIFLNAFLSFKCTVTTALVLTVVSGERRGGASIVTTPASPLLPKLALLLILEMMRRCLRRGTAATNNRADGNVLVREQGPWLEVVCTAAAARACVADSIVAG